MNLPRRKFLHLAAGAATLPVLPRVAVALDYPIRPVHIVVGFPAGLTPDVLARLVGQPLSERLGQPVVIDNRPGAGSNIGTELVVRALPDGYTLLLAPITTSVVNAILYPDLKFNFLRDVAPVASIGRNPFVMVVNPTFPAKTVAEFIAYAKANPGQINMTSTGTGNLTHVIGELFKMMGGVDLLHVPYRNSFVPDLLGGQVQVGFITVALALEYSKDGRLRALGVTSATRVAALPDVPAIAEFVPGYDASGWNGIGAPKDTPSEIIEKLNREISAVVADPDLNAHLIGLGIKPVAMTPAELGKLIADESDKWTKVVKFANIKPE
jgi:tripartite-type tricarboxylate transporter receptor subunit TctC